MKPSPLHLFEGFGVELEYMIVDRDTLAVLPIADQLLGEAGEYATDDEAHVASWSNELILHVMELKNTRPVTSLEFLPNMFQQQLQRMEDRLAPFNATLMPSGMHPWMNPGSDARLWPHAFREVYATYHRVFNCFRHGWANLQSVHLNLPFADEDEFARLHAAVRVLLPILPAIAASSPICDGRATGLMDTRMDVYRSNASLIPAVTGQVIPEPVFGIDQYHEQILQRMYVDIAPHDPQGILQHEFLNARGAIARFDRGAMEIRVLDVQECPVADVAICAAIVFVLGQLVAESWSDLRQQQAWQVAPLQRLFMRCVKDAERATIEQGEYLELFGYGGKAPATAQQLWRHLIGAAVTSDADFSRCWRSPLAVILDRGPLSRRIEQCLGPDVTRERMEETYRLLCDCLRTGTMFGHDC